MLKAAVVATLSNDANRGAYVSQLNSMGLTWTAGINPRFKGEPLGVSKSLCGVKDDNLEKMKEAILAGEIEVSEAPINFAAPDTFDSATNWPKCSKVIDDIRDQSNCGCCWAFGGASAASDRLCIATNGTTAVPLSAEAVCFCASMDGCGGGFLQATWGYVKKGSVTGGNQGDTGPLGGGFCSEFSLPHCHHHGPQGQDPYPDEGSAGCPTQDSPKCGKQCDASAKAPHNEYDKDKYHFTGSIQSYSNEAAIQNAIMTAGPVETAFTVYQDFENYVSGVYKKSSSTVLGGHAVRLLDGVWKDPPNTGKLPTRGTPSGGNRATSALFVGLTNAASSRRRWPMAQARGLVPLFSKHFHE